MDDHASMRWGRWPARTDPSRISNDNGSCDDDVYYDYIVRIAETIMPGSDAADDDGTVGCSFVVVLFQYAVYPQQHPQHVSHFSRQWIFRSYHVPLGFVRKSVSCSECSICSSHLVARWSQISSWYCHIKAIFAMLLLASNAYKWCLCVYDMNSRVICRLIKQFHWIGT